MAKYVANGSYNAEMLKLPLHPSLLLIQPGNDLSHLKLNVTVYNMISFLRLFNPTTKVLILTNKLDPLGRRSFESKIDFFAYLHSVYVDSCSMQVRQCNGVWCANVSGVPPPMFLFSSARRWVKGRNITYITPENVPPWVWCYHWLNETARYMRVEAIKYVHDCHGVSTFFYRCLRTHAKRYKRFDILFDVTYMVQIIPRAFQVMFTSNPSMYKIAVPRGRPLNIAELLVMPFSWHVWTLLVTILVLSEVGKRLFPDLFKNDPFLLAVCGFERHNLHQAGRWEKLCFLSLIILMFFMSSAFETKIVSLMVKKPSVQRINTLEDLARSGLKFNADLKNSPDHVKHPIIGKMIAQANYRHSTEYDPALARFSKTEMIDFFVDMAYDFERMQPFYVIMEYEYYQSPEFYISSGRSTFMDVFRFIHITLTEAGLFTVWQRQWKDELRAKYIGRRRHRVSIESELDLNFDDIKPAWMVLAVGLGVGFVAFFGELLYDYFRKKCLVIVKKIKVIFL